MSPLESQVLTVIREHPEYHPALASEDSLVREFVGEYGEQNPFLHMGLHIAINEQISMDRPLGITSLYNTMLGKYQNRHKLQHRMMGGLEQALRLAQEKGQPPDEQAYMDSLRKLG